MAGDDEFELLTLNGGRALLVIDYEGAGEARSGATLNFVDGRGVLNAPGQRREFQGLSRELLREVESFQVAEVDASGRPMRIYRCHIVDGTTP